VQYTAFTGQKNLPVETRFDLFCQERQNLVYITNNTERRNAENRRFWVFIDGHNGAAGSHSGQMLDRATDTGSDIEFRTDRLSGLTGTQPSSTIAREAP